MADRRPLVNVSGSLNELPTNDRLPTDTLGSGTPDSTKFLRGDQVWAVPAGGGSGLGSLTAYDSAGVQDDLPVNALSTLDSLTVNSELVLGPTLDFYSGVSGNYGWRDLFGGMDPRSGVSGPTWTLFRNGLYLYAFSATQVREVFASFHIDHDYALGTVLYPHMHYTVNTTSSGVVRWGFEYSVAKGHQQATGSVYGATTTVYVNQTVNGATDQYKHFVAEVSLADAIPSTNIEPDTVILVRVFRDAANAADTYPDVVFGIQTDMHYQTARFSTPQKSPDFFAP
jgi:hypothetical protein